MDDKELLIIENAPRVKTAEEWVRFLRSEIKGGKDKTLDVLRFFYGSKDFTSYCQAADRYYGWKDGSANGILNANHGFAIRAINFLGLKSQYKQNGAQRCWNVAFTRFPEGSSPFFRMKLRPELVAAIREVFPDWQEMCLPKNEILYELDRYKRKPLELGENVKIDAANLNIISRKLVDRENTSDKSPAPNYVKKAVAEVYNAHDGKQVENLIYEQETARLRGEGLPENHLEAMQKFFDNRKDYYGYDILSFEKVNGEWEERYIEVKSTKREGSPIDITANEIVTALKSPEKYRIYRVIVHDENRLGLTIISGEELFRKYTVCPTRYQIYGPTEMNDEAALKLISALKWNFAKTYAKTSPHEYAVIKLNHPLRAEAVAFMKYIFKHGEVELYCGKPFTVYKIGGRKYWCMAEDTDHVSDENYILNRSMEYNVDKTYN